MLHRNVDAQTISSPALPDKEASTRRSASPGLTLTARLAIAMILLVAITVLAVGWFSYRSLEQALIPRVLERIESHSRFVAADLESHIRSAPGDITTFANLEAVAGLVRARLNGGTDPVEYMTEAAWRERLEGRLAAQMALKPAYLLRFIGVADNHKEIVRVDRSGKAACRRGPRAKAGPQGAVHVRIHRGCHRPSRQARFRRAAARKTLSQGRSRADDPESAGRLGRALLRGHHDSHQVGGILRAQLFHDVGAVVLDGARADPERTSGLLVGSARCELLQHFTLAARQGFPSGEMQRGNIGGRVL